jgi:hypothetical protein
MLRVDRAVYAPMEEISGSFVGDHMTVESRSSRGEGKGSRYSRSEVRFTTKVTVNLATFEQVQAVVMICKVCAHR